MTDLDNVPAMKALDRSDVYGSISKLADQAEQAWDEIGKIGFPAKYRNAGSIVVSGMGGSSIGAHLVQAAYSDTLRVPMILVNDYQLPQFVDSSTLVVLSSYSGTTEEVLAASLDAQKRKAMITGITTGGALAEFFSRERIPAYVFDAKHNPAGQPRLAIGYSVVGQVALFSKLGYVTVKDSEVSVLFRLLKSGEEKYGRGIAEKQNEAKRLAQHLYGKIPVLVVSRHLEGAAHVFANQLNESSKTFSEYRVIPELNHHLMEGLMHPALLKEGMVFVFFNSSLYDERLHARFSLTRVVVEKNGVAAADVSMTQTSPLLQAFELVLFGSYVNYYLAMRYDVDPQPIPWVDYFKKNLGKTFS